MQLINLLYVSFLPERTSIFKSQNYLAYASCMKPGCSEMIQSVSPHRAARNTSLLHHSLLTTHYHAATMLTSSLDVLAYSLVPVSVVPPVTSIRGLLKKTEVKTQAHSIVQLTAPCFPVSFQSLLPANEKL